MKSSQIANNKWTFIIASCILGTWMLTVITGEYLPYLDTQSSSDVRSCIVFPILSILIVWFVFLHKWAETGATGYQMRMLQLTKRSERIKHTLILVAGLSFLAGFLTWTSINIARWAAYLSPSQPFSQAYRVVGKKAVSSKFDIEMISISDKRKATLRLTRTKFAQRDWEIGGAVCTKGRISMFGIIIETITSYDSLAGCK